jgi:ribosomal protein L6P/L9E
MIFWKLKKMIIIPEKVRFELYSYIYTLKGINLDYSLRFIPFRVYVHFMNTISEFIKRERKNDKTEYVGG